MFCTDILNTTFLIFSKDVPSILYYSHIPTVILTFFIASFVFIKSRMSLSSIILLFISILIFIWSFFSLITWTNSNSNIIMFVWSIFVLLDVLIFAANLYFSYVFIDKEDLSLNKKIIISLLILPVFFLTFTKLNLTSFDVVTCESKEGLLVYYGYFIEILFTVWILLLCLFRYRKAEGDLKKQILLFGIGIFLFLLSFSWANIAGSFTLNWNITEYGFFGMPFFMGFLAYLIVKYKAFDIKLIGAQALVVALIILVGSQFFFAQSLTSNILTGITLVLVGGIGIALIRSVKLEVERKEQLQEMTDSLAKANDQLRILDNAKTEFISIASHQLRTPVTAIKGFASLLLEGSYGEISAGVQGALEKMYISSERLVNLIEDLLNVSRIESGRLTFNFENANITNILKELHENFLILAKSKKFYLDLKLPKEPLPEFKMDCNKIRELISNFIDNALKYTEKGGVTISAEIKENGAVIDEKGFVKEGEKAPYGKVVRITVSDTGIGIPKEEIPFLFRKFSRGKDVSRLHVGGTGLGLFVGKAIADAHHGATWVESEGTGKGSRFIIEIPINNS